MWCQLRNWGFENEFDLFLAALVKSTNYTASTTWNVQKYLSRAEIFRGAATQEFAAAPTILVYVDSLLGRAANLQPTRNLLAHGRLKDVLEVVGTNLDNMHITTTLHAQDQRKNKTVTFSPETIEDHFYKLAHLSGVMHRLASVDDPPKEISSTDRPTLRAFLLAHHPQYANNQKPEPQLGSSGG